MLRITIKNSQLCLSCISWMEILLCRWPVVLPVFSVSFAKYNFYWLISPHLQAIESVRSAAEHKVVDIFVLLILHSSNHRKSVESLLRNKIRSGHFTEVLLHAAFGSHAQVLKYEIWCLRIELSRKGEFTFLRPEQSDSLVGRWHIHMNVNSLRPSDTIWRQRSGSTLVQVMACCLTAPSHYLNHCWLIISKV